MDGGPRIDLWYGKRQSFGRSGHPQRWANVLGRVVSSAIPVKTLQYSLNGSPLMPLSIGPDQRRLVAKGDFNIDLDIRKLNPGQNVVDIIATDEAGRTTCEQVMMDFAAESCPQPYSIEWDRVANIQDVAHVVDGLWSIHAGGISPEEIGYDRLVAIGDMNWRDYEVTVSITIHGINGGCYAYPSVHVGVGIVMRWKGHNNWGSDQWASGQPYFGPSPYGAIAWYCVFHQTGPELNFFDPDFQRPVRKPITLRLHLPYMFKVRGTTGQNQVSQFKLKVWQAGTSEPAAWDLTAAGHKMSLTEGSLMLGAHHVAACFGDVTVDPV